MSNSTTTESPAAEPSQTRPGAPRRPKPELGVAPAWWPLAHSSEVVQHPKSFRIGVRDLAVYRDLKGVVRAVDDSCPHRRLPLSMGRITEDGYLQCKYHGWCFDGTTGRCTAIPNLHEDEKIPGGIRVAAFTTAENVADVLGFGLRTNLLAPAVGPPTGEEPDDGTTMFDTTVADGLVLVWTGDEDPEPGSRPEPGALANAPSLAGKLEVRAPHSRVAEALLFNPGAALGLGPLIGAGEELCDPWVASRGEAVTVRRERLALALPRASTFRSPSRRVVTSTTTTVPTTGLTRIEVEADGHHPGVRAVVGATPIGSYRTIVRWGVQLNGGTAIRPALIRAVHAVRRAAGRAADSAERVADAVDGVADDGLDALRRLRTTDHQHQTDGGPS